MSGTGVNTLHLLSISNSRINHLWKVDCPVSDEETEA